MAYADCFCNQENVYNIFILYLIDIIYIMDFCLSFFKGYYNYQLKVVQNNTKIIIHYLKGDFFFDFLEAIPFFSYSKYLCSISSNANYCFKYDMAVSLILIKILTNLKIFKMFKVRNKQKNTTINFLLNFSSENYSFEKFMENLLDFSFCFLVFHFFICLNIFLAKQTYPNWLITINTQDENFLRNYITSCYSLAETLTTVGYGDVVCQSTIERIFQIIFLAVGVIAYSYLISSFGNLIKNERQSSIKYNNNMKILEEIRVDYPNMPFKFYNKIYNYIESRNIAEKKLDANYLTNSLPFNLRNALLLIMYRSCIKNFKFFKNCENSNFIIQILSTFIPSTSKKADILVYEGEMIEEIIIVKDGRLSLEAAIDTEDPESSIKQYFNVNFAGITTAKEIKKLQEKKLNTSQLIKSKKTKDFDKAKNVLTTVLKRQANFLLNDGAADDPSFLDKTKNDYKNENPKDKMMHLGNNYLNHEPIKNEKGNYKYIKIIDIRKNENFGGLYMFMRRPSPLSVKVKSKFAELYLIPKKDIFEIAKNYNNIWNKIHKKDFHNMLSIKHKTFNILNKYIEINGIGKITPTDVSRFVYAWDDKNRTTNLDNINIEQLNNISQLTYINHQVNASPVNSKLSQECNFTPMFKKDLINNKLPQMNISNNVPSTKSIEKNIQDPNNQRIPTEVDFTQLLTLMANPKQAVNTTSNNNNSRLQSNTNNQHTINDNEQHSNVKNTIENNIKENNEKESSHHSFAEDFFNNKQKTNNISDEGATIIITHDKESLLPSTLHHIFT
jgi:hypothetical protein